MIFVHLPKNGGASVKTVLRTFEDFEFAFEYHTPMVQIRSQMDTSGYTAFAFVRNPWDRMWSFYNHRKPDAEFNEWILSLEFSDEGVAYNYCRSQLYWLADCHGNLLVDVIGRFETIEQDFYRLFQTTLPHVRKKAEERHYREVYSQESRDWIATNLAPEIELFGYIY